MLSAALSTGIAIAGVIIFFAIQWPGVKIKWWGNTVSFQGCEDTANACVLYTLDKGEYFGPRIGDFH